MESIATHLEAATRAIGRGEPEAALAALDAALTRIPGDAPAAGVAALHLARGRALDACGRYEQALAAALDADRIVAALPNADPAVRVGTLAAAVGYAAAAGADEAGATLAGFLATQALNAKDIVHAVAGKVLEAEARLRLGDDAAALECARLAAGQGTRLTGDARAAWLPRAAEAQGVAARRQGSLLEAREAIGLATSELDGPATPRLRLVSATTTVAFDHATADAVATLEDLARSEHEVAGDAALALAEVATREGRLDEASRWLDRAEASGAAAGRAAAARIGVALRRGDGEAAVADARALSDRYPGYAATLLLADGLLASDEPVEAFMTIDRAVAQATEAGSEAGQMRARYSRAALALHLGDIDGARADARHGIELARRLGAPAGLATGHALVARALLASERVDEAMDELVEAMGEVERMGATHRAAELGLLYVFAERTWPEAPEAPAEVEETLERATLSPDLRLAVLAHLVLAPRAAAAGDTERARDHVGRARALDARAALGMTELIGRLTATIGLGIGSA